MKPLSTLGLLGLVVGCRTQAPPAFAQAASRAAASTKRRAGLGRPADRPVFGGGLKSGEPRAFFRWISPPISQPQVDRKSTTCQGSNEVNPFKPSGTPGPEDLIAAPGGSEVLPLDFPEIGDEVEARRT